MIYWQVVPRRADSSVTMSYQKVSLRFDLLSSKEDEEEYEELVTAKKDEQGFLSRQLT